MDVYKQDGMDRHLAARVYRQAIVYKRERAAIETSLSRIRAIRGTGVSCRPSATR